MTDKEKIKELEEKIDSIAAELNTLKSSNLNKNDFDPVLIQIERNNINARMCEDGIKPEEYEKLQKHLDNLPVIFGVSDVQDIIDLFDFDVCVEVSQKLGWTYQDKLITKKILVENAIELLNKAINCTQDCGRLQLGRLVVNFFTSPEGDKWYTMTFFVEHEEEC